MFLSIWLTHKTRNVFSVFYRPPNSDAVSFLFQLNQFLDKVSRTGLSNVIVTGDFNFPHIDWCTGRPLRYDPSTEEFCNLLDDFFLVQKNTHVTRGLCSTNVQGSILDLVFTNNDFLVRDVSVHPNTFHSDHYPPTSTLHAKVIRPKNVRRKMYCY